MTPADPQQTDAGSRHLLLVGAGLANGLIALRMARQDPQVRITMIDGATEPFGEHTWSFHTADLSPEDLDWVLPVAAHSWTGQQVRFRAHSRTLGTGYASLTSASVRSAVESLPNVEIRTGAPVAEVHADRVVLASGETVAADCVIDARGHRKSPHMQLGFQKFVGLEIETETPHGISVPMIMDASVDQKDGYRFVYLLPFSPTRLLIEDTRYADGEALDLQALAGDISEYAAARGWEVKSVVREEHGVLPIALAFDAEAFWRDAPPDVPQAGMRAGLFHPTTGYSLPEAVRVANVVADSWPTGSAALAGRIREHALGRARAQSFYRLLNRMLFRAAIPTRRHLVLERFYRLPQSLIERFYAGRTTPADIARILIGKPPVPIGRALSCLSERRFLQDAGK
ncbi:lycopene cyclase [Arsenicitalea aurantiaca]|uniref:Lycopene cyclase n=1 Tax=Arsenicitalea aurantiaca TaxID=1783274 RepID=A0A433XF82_9HYPH|nr:lycopene beta-cyclase CrtY [Arsenicitalea aurantiaca]RUT32761.1 lycopene cyclase [Arsenicitalea aurantiaca]